MEKYTIILFLTLFLLGIPFFLKVLSDTHLERLFKQGKVQSIRILLIVLSIIISFLLALAIKTLLENIISLFTI